MSPPQRWLTRRDALVAAGTLLAGCNAPTDDRDPASVTPAEVPVAPAEKAREALAVEVPTVSDPLAITDAHLADVRRQAIDAYRRADDLLRRVGPTVEPTVDTTTAGTDGDETTASGGTTSDGTTNDGTTTRTSVPVAEIESTRENLKSQTDRLRTWLDDDAGDDRIGYIRPADRLIGLVEREYWHLRALVDTVGAEDRPDPLPVAADARALRDDLVYHTTPARRGALLVRFRALEERLDDAIDEVERWDSRDSAPADPTWALSVGVAGGVRATAERHLRDARYHRQAFRFSRPDNAVVAPFDLTAARGRLRGATVESYTALSDEFADVGTPKRPYDVLARTVPSLPAHQRRLREVATVAQSGMPATAVSRLAAHLLQYRAIGVARERFVDPDAEELPPEAVVSEKRAAVDRLAAALEATDGEPFARDLLSWSEQVIRFGDNVVESLGDDDGSPGRDAELADAYLGYLAGFGGAASARDVARLARGEEA